jgi:chromosome segregation ATPase
MAEMESQDNAAEHRKPESEEVAEVLADVRSDEKELQELRSEIDSVEHRLEHDEAKLEKLEHRQYVEVEIATTSGFYPENRSARVPVHQLVEVELAKAANALRLTDTRNWVASVNKQSVNPKLSYEANHLKDKVVIDWGPAEGGGGV